MLHVKSGALIQIADVLVFPVTTPECLPLCHNIHHMRPHAHCRRSRPYVMVMLALVLSGTLASQQNPQRTKSNGAVSAEESKLFELLNQARSENGLPALRWNDQLATAARRHAVLMADRKELSHDFPGESNLQERAAAAAVRFSRIAENVGLGPTPERIHDLLMHSAGHRANILDSDSNEVGIAIVRRDKSLFAVQDFAHTVAFLDAGQQTELVSTLLQNEGFTVANLEHDMTRYCVNDSEPALPGVSEIFHFETADLSKLPDALKQKDLKKRYRNAAVASCKVGPQPESLKGFIRYRMVVLLY
jgi:uncharacterized protein YkwD